MSIHFIHLPRMAVTLFVALMTLASHSAAAEQDLADLSLEELMNEPIRALARRTNSRDRTELAEPVLSYSEEFFQRFEPLSVGEMLKRVPGVTFSSDIGEYAEPSLRGIGAGYTQVLIDGRRVTGSGNDNTVLVDRIPAELVDRIEIIRSPTSDMDSQGIGGTLNVILKEGAAFEGGISRVGAYHIDGKTRPSTFVFYGHSSDAVQWGTSFNYQERFNRKQVFAVERLYDGEGNAQAEFAAKVEPDERETRDMAWTGDLTFRFDGGQELAFNGLLIDTDREELQFERAFKAADLDGELDSEAGQSDQREVLREQNWLLATTFSSPLGDGRSYELSASYDRTDGDALETNYVAELADFDFSDVGIDSAADILPLLSSRSDRQLSNDLRRGSTQLGREIEVFDHIDDVKTTTVRDSEAKAGGRITQQLESSSLSAGVEYVRKQREFDSNAQEPDGGELVVLDESFSVFDATEERVNAFVRWGYEFGRSKLELGVRGEQTNLEMTSTVADPIAQAAGDLASLGLNANGDRVAVDRDYFELNPSAHFRWSSTDAIQFRLSAARTVRRPAFNELNPTLLLDEEESLLGNPDLTQETALGVDGGVDLKLNAKDAILGVNAFYRRIQDKIELNGVGDEVNALLQTQIDDEIEAIQYVNNRNAGTVYGVELDLSYPLALLNAPNFHVFANYTYVHSKIRDANANFPIERRFSMQPDYIYNLGFDHLIEPWRMTWGASYQRRGAAEDWGDVGAQTKEVADVTFGGNLEMFIEKTFADRYVVRLAAQNLLDAVRKDVTRRYESLDQYSNRTPVAVELDQEESASSVILTFRSTF
ncbi:MAG: TonB-dependent receptor plug domain-containing protein [Steroidobacter sp.]